MTIHLTRSGKGPALVLFHGWGFDSRIWNSILPVLENTYEMYCVDLPGFGLSALMDWSSFKTHLLKQLPHQFAIGGWSLGGMVATRFALEEPSHVTHLISIASSPCFIEDLSWPGVPKTQLSAFYHRLMTDPEKVLNEFMSLQVPRHNFQRFETSSIKGLQMGLDWLLTWDFRERLVTLNIPALYLFGRLDSIIPSKTMLVMQENYPHFQYMMLSRAAHALFLSNREEFLKAITEFLGS